MPAVYRPTLTVRRQRTGQKKNASPVGRQARRLAILDRPLVITVVQVYWFSDSSMTSFEAFVPSEPHNP